MTPVQPTQPVRPMRLALWQGPSPAGDAAAALDAVARTLAAAAAMGADLAVFPELLLPGYNHANLAAQAQPADGPWVQRLSDLARQHGVALVAGFAERAGEQLWNSAIALSARGETLALYRKIQLYGPREKALFAPGQDYATFSIAGRRAALLICYDIEFAPHVAALAAQGVDLVLVPTANMLPFTHVSRATVPAMAANHAVTIAYANFCGVEGDLTYAGASLIAGPDGEVLAQAGQGPCLLVADLIPADPARLSTQLADFRPVSSTGA